MRFGYRAKGIGCLGFWTALAMGTFSTMAASAAEEQVPTPSFHLGDTWTYSYVVDEVKQFDFTEVVKALDGRSLELLTDTTTGLRTIVTFDSERPRYLVRYELKEGKSEREGPILTDETKNDPPIKFPFVVGASWPVALTYAPFTMDLTARVVGREVVKVPAGIFDAYKVELTGLYRDHSVIGIASSGRYSETYWYSPDVKRHVRKEVRYWGVSWLHTTSAPMYHRVQELLSFRLSPI